MSTLSKITNSGKALWIVLIVLGSLSVIIAGIIALLQYNDVTIRNGMQEYLYDKYGKKFTVTDVEIRSAGIGIPGQLAGKATPVDDKNLVFEVGKSRSAGGKYFDDYDGAVWAREERPRVEAFLKTIYGENIPQFDLITHISTTEEPDPIRGEVPSIDDAMKKYGNNFYYSLEIRTIIDHELSQAEIKVSTLEMKRIIDFVLAKNISHPVVRYAINIRSQEAGYLCSLSGSRITDAAEVDSCIVKVNRKVW